MIANPVTALPVGYPRSGLSRSDLVLWPFAPIRGEVATRSLSERSGRGPIVALGQSRREWTRLRHWPRAGPTALRSCF